MVLETHHHRMISATHNCKKPNMLGSSLNITNNDPLKTVSNVEAQILSRTNMQQTTEKFKESLVDIITFARRNQFPVSFFSSPQWWWIGHLCIAVPRFCVTAPHADCSKLIELLCTELHANRNVKVNCSHDLSMTIVEKPVSLSSHLQSLFVKVRSANLVPSLLTHLPGPLDPVSSQKQEKATAHRADAEEADEDGVLSKPLKTPSSNDPSLLQSRASDTDEFTEGEVENECDKEVLNGSNSLKYANPLDAKVPYSYRRNFKPLPREEVVEITANIIKSSEAKIIEPLKNIIPTPVVQAVKRLLEEEYF